MILRRDLVALVMGLPEEKGLCERPAFMKNGD
jgi:hypothetical protein